jgi:hypothetical protein
MNWDLRQEDEGRRPTVLRERLAFFFGMELLVSGTRQPQQFLIPI